MRPTYAALALSLVTACAPTIESNGIRVRKSYWEPVEREISARARADLQCPQVIVLMLKRQGKAPVSVSAEGCGRTAVYRRLLRHHLLFHSTSNSLWEVVSISPIAATVAAAPTATNPYADDDAPITAPGL